ncbi:hypothetical protein JEQ12_006656 [Ovis aries]|uniref:Uncharacterized protein n=1 Tax=Ovis aries TaxID=9940 RepID=A0A835ZV22_SHEEP|nr:hypothetical protein JEQ12_006656 [Ovis aries]
MATLSFVLSDGNECNNEVSPPVSRLYPTEVSMGMSTEQNTDATLSGSVECLELSSLLSALLSPLFSLREHLVILKSMKNSTEYGCCSLVYLRPRSSTSEDEDRQIALIYTFVTPLLNPLIYTLRNKDVKGALKNAFVSKAASDNT